MKKIKLAVFAAVALTFGLGEMPPAGQNSVPSLFGFINEDGQFQLGAFRNGHIDLEIYSN